MLYINMVKCFLQGWLVYNAYYKLCFNVCRHHVNSKSLKSVKLNKFPIIPIFRDYITIKIKIKEETLFVLF